MQFKKLRTVSLWTAGILLSAALVLLAAQRFLGPEVKRLFISELNKYLQAEVTLDDVELSLIRDFPNASVRFTGVKIREAVKPRSPNYLATAGTISFRFNVWDLLRKKYSITSIKLIGVNIAPHIYSDGSDNFHFWKPSAGNSGESFHFELKRVLIQDLHFRLINDITQLEAEVDLPAFVARGDFGSNQYALGLSGDVLIRKLISGGTAYANDRRLSLSLALDANTSSGVYWISEGKITTGKLNLSASGNLLYSENRKIADISLKATGSTLEEMISLVPEKYKAQIRDYSFSGKSDFSAAVKGGFGNGHNPSVSLRLKVENGSVSERSSGIRLDRLSVDASYSSGQDGANQQLTLRNLKASLGDGYLSGSLSMNGFQAPDIKCSLAASLNLAEVQQFFRFSEFSSLSGGIRLNASFDGKIADLRNPTPTDFLNSRISGSGSIQKASVVFTKYGLPLKSLNADFGFNGNDLNINQLGFTAGRSDFNLRGTLGNLITWIFVRDQMLSFSGVLSSERFDWDELSSAQKNSGGGYRFRLPSDIRLSDVKIHTGAFSFGKFRAQNLTGIAMLDNGILAVRDISMITCQGRVSGEANINARSPGYSLLQAKARLERVNVKMLFTQFGNFGQNSLEDENLEGILTADVIFAATMKDDLSIDLNSVKSHAEIEIAKGRLVNYKPMQSLSGFLKMEDLTDIRFETLRNQIDIANEIIYIPSMEIRSSALNLQLMGTHTFDNALEYHFTIGLADLLAARFKKRNPSPDRQEEFGPVEDDGRGQTKIYVSLTGTVENPVVKYDKKALSKKLAGDMKAQKTELRQAFRQEFRQLQGDTLRKARNGKEKEQLKQQEQGKFVIEWDEGDK
jgi:hypothetical protein